jgi:hypothetical protein
MACQIRFSNNCCEPNHGVCQAALGRRAALDRHRENEWTAREFDLGIEKTSEARERPCASL